MFKRLKPKSEFTKNVLTLMTGTTIAQAIPIAISPILTRIYTPEDFGLFALYMSVASVIAVMATGRYELAIMLPEDDEDAINIVILSIVIAFFVSFIVLLIVYMFNAQITSFLGNPQISNWLYFMPLTVLLTGLYQSSYYWNNRLKQYSKLANSRILQSITTSSSNILIGYSTFKFIGLVFGTILGQLISTFFLLRVMLTDENFNIKKAVQKRKILFLAKKNIKFPTWNLFASLLNTIRLNLIIVFFSRYFLSTTLGYYYFADKLLRAPSNVLVASFSDVYYQRLSKIHSHSEIYELSISYTKKMFKILLIPYLILLICLKPMVPFIFGEQWSILYLYLYILSVPIFFNIIIAHFSKILIVINRQEVSFRIHLYKMIGLIVVLLLIYLYELFNIKAIIILSINEIIWLFIGLIVIKNTLKVVFHEILLYAIVCFFIFVEILIYMLLI